MQFIASWLALAFAVSSLVAQGERDWVEPNNALWRFDLTPAQVQTELQTSKGRIIDIEVLATTPIKLAIATVENTGRFAQQSWWYVDVTAATLATHLSTNNARLIDLEAYEVAGQTRFAAVMVRNTAGVQWWWMHDVSLSAIKSQASSFRARVLDVEEYTIGSRVTHAAVLVANTGQQARTWWLYTDVAQASLPGLLNLHNARFVDLERTAAGKYHAILHQSTGERTWHYFGIDASNIDRLVRRNGARVIDADMTHSVLSVQLYHVVMIDNSNPLTLAVGEVLRNGLATADFGFHFKQLNGPELAGMAVDTVFEPASLFKTLHHVHAMDQVKLGKEKLETVHRSQFDNSEGCPTGNSTWVNETYRETLRKMMQESSNTRTRWVETRFGRPALMQTAAALGMKNTAINHNIGCSTIDNAMTLRDVSALHESVAKGYLGSVRELFYDIMLSEHGPADYPGWGNTKLSTGVIDVEARKAGLTAAQTAAFKSLVRFAYKPGGYFFIKGTFITVGGWFQIPRYEKGAIISREYTVGCFVSGAVARTVAESVIGDAASELVRSEFRNALETFRGFTPGSHSSFGTGCAGTNGVPAQSAQGVVALGQRLTLELRNAGPSTPVLIWIGASKMRWNGASLPLGLGFMGAPTCLVLCDDLLALGAFTDAKGALDLVAPIPADPRMFRLTAYTQFWVADPKANSAGFITSNGLQLTIGG